MLGLSWNRKVRELKIILRVAPDSGSRLGGAPPTNSQMDGSSQVDSTPALSSSQGPSNSSGLASTPAAPNLIPDDRELYKDILNDLGGSDGTGWDENPWPWTNDSFLDPMFNMLLWPHSQTYT